MTPRDSKRRKFISVIWGYHKQMFSFSKAENYHVAALAAAAELGYVPEVMLVNPEVDISDDPNFDVAIRVERYSGPVSYIKYLIKNREHIIYANSFVWQSLLVSLICPHAIFMGHDSVKRKTALKQKIENFVFKRFEKIRTISQDEKDFLVGQGIPAAKIEVVPLAIDLKTFSYQENSDRSDIVFLGNVAPDKNIGDIARALALVVKKHPDVILRILGEIREPSFRELIKELGIEKNVAVKGFVPHAELSSSLNQCKICVNSSISEGQCLAVYEAAACGAALCLPTTMSFKSVFQDKALFHDLFNSRMLAQNIMRYLEDEELRTAHNKKCREMIAREYNPDAVNSKFKKLISSI